MMTFFACMIGSFIGNIVYSYRKEILARCCCRAKRLKDVLTAVASKEDKKEPTYVVNVEEVEKESEHL